MLQKMISFAVYSLAHVMQSQLGCINLKIAQVRAHNNLKDGKLFAKFDKKKYKKEIIFTQANNAKIAI